MASAFRNDRPGGVDRVGLVVELRRHREKDRAHPLAQRAAGHETAMCGMTPEVPRFVVHPTQTEREAGCSGRSDIKPWPCRSRSSKRRKIAFPIWISSAPRWSMNAPQGLAAPASGTDIPDSATPAADPEIAPLLDFEPVVRKVKRPDGWTPELQRELIARIASTGTLQSAVWQMGKHATGAEASRARAPEPPGRALPGKAPQRRGRLQHRHRPARHRSHRHPRARLHPGAMGADGARGAEASAAAAVRSGRRGAPSP